MVLAAVKEMNVKKGASIIAIFKYISAVYRYDIQRNKRLLKRTLEKLIAEQVVEQVKGHGLAGSFKLGKNYKEQKRRERTKEQVKLASIATSKNGAKADLSTHCILQSTTLSLSQYHRTRSFIKMKKCTICFEIHRQGSRNYK